MDILNRGVLADAIRAVEATDSLPAEARARLIGKLTLLKDSLCLTPQDCDGCAIGCACRALVQRLFATPPAADQSSISSSSVLRTTCTISAP